MQHNERKGGRTYVGYIQSDASDPLNIKSSPLCARLCSLNVSDIWWSGSMEDESHSKPNTSTSTSLHRHMDSHHIQVKIQEHTAHLGPLCGGLSEVLQRWQRMFFVLLHFPLSYVTRTFIHTHTHTHNRTDIWTTTTASDLGSFFDLLTFWLDWKVGSFEKHVSPMTRELSLSGGWCSVTGLSLMLYWLTVPDRHVLTGKHNEKTHWHQCAFKGHFVAESSSSFLWYL